VGDLQFKIILFVLFLFDIILHYMCSLNLPSYTGCVTLLIVWNNNKSDIDCNNIFQAESPLLLQWNFLLF